MDLLEGLDRCVGEIVTEMLRLIESSSSSAARRAQGQGHVQQLQPPPGGHAQECEEEVQLCMLLPHLDHFLAQLVQTDARYALQCLDQYIRLVRWVGKCGCYRDMMMPNPDPP
jgi:hypothetical protein